MKQIVNVAIVENVEFAQNIYRLIVKADISGKPGQFIQVRLPSEEFTLRRPFGIAGTDNGHLKMFYRVVGRGTDYLTSCKAGTELNLLGPLGNSFDIFSSRPPTPSSAPLNAAQLSNAQANESQKISLHEHILMIGGGMGLAPLLFAASEAKSADIFMGGRNAQEVIAWQNEFKPLVDNIFVMTDDGSYGHKGFVTDFLPDALSKTSYDKILVCGPEIMMRKVAAIAKEHNIACQVSMEKRMACGLGACLSCSIDTVNGRRKVCKDGPIFNAEEVFYV